MSRPLLLVDVGNSRVKWTLTTEPTWTTGVPFPTHEPSLHVALDQHWSELQCPERLVISNVAGPDIAEYIDSWVQRHWAVPVVYARSEKSGGGVLNGYAQPEQFGVDRWLGLLGLFRDHPLPACLVDCGTAITVDVLDERGCHRGGLITPGLKTMRRTLQVNAHALDYADDQISDLALGQDTPSCIQAGCLMACAGLIEKTLTLMAGEIDKPLRVILTGGDALQIGQCLSIPYELDDSIVMRGLWGWSRNQS